MKLPEQNVLDEIYGEYTESIKRYRKLAMNFQKNFRTEEMEFFSSPGRTEILGNHTDHNGGKVLAASIDMDTIGAAAPNYTNQITIISEGYKEKIEIDMLNLDSIPKNQGTLSLVAGMIYAIKSSGFAIEGFNAYISTNVIGAAGVSSSASFEMLLCAIINFFFNDNAMNCMDCAKIGQDAENKYWNKASGLLDQMACAVGGVVCFDFSEDVKYKKIDVSFSQMGYDFFIINTGKSHADLSNVYSEIPLEMKLVAQTLGKKKLSESDEKFFLELLPKMEKNILNDRAVLRAFHFFEENKRVEAAVKAITEGNYSKLLEIIKEAGNSSWKWLQNCYTIENYKEQKVTYILALTEYFLNQIKDGCCRVHGGGFAGVIMTMIPIQETSNYIKFIAKYIQEENIYKVHIRKCGAIHLEAKS